LVDHSLVSGLIASVKSADARKLQILAHAVTVEFEKVGLHYTTDEIVSEAKEYTKTSLALDKRSAESSVLVNPKLRAVDVNELASMHFREREALLSPFLHTQDQVMVHGPRGVGKTHLLLPMAFAVATGGKFLSWDAPKARKVVYLDGELPGNVVQRRMLMHCPDAVLEPGYLKIFTPDLPEMEGRGLPDLSTVAGQAEINEMLDPDTALVIVDNLSAWARTGRENESESWLPIADWTLSLRRRGIAVLLVHHSGKNGEQRGTSKKEDLLDVVIKLSRPKDYDPRQGAAFVLEFTKARHLTGDAAESLEIALGGDENIATWTYTALEDSTFDRVVKLAKEALSPNEIANELGVNKSTVSRHLRAAREAGTLAGKA
jgi:putative DNA primase/helicase